MNAPMSIRRAAGDDRDLLVALGRETFFDTFVGTCSDEDMDLFLRESFAPEKVEKELGQEGSYFYLLSGTGGEALGYARLFVDPELGESLPETYCENAIELVRFYFKREAFGTGAAQLLMAHCLEEARKMGFGRMYLGVWEKNLRAQRFYEKSGFRKIAEKIFMVGNDAQTDWYFGREI
jgi:ribosomal protein S18 acetylase RimI-like enzyme